MDLIFRGLIVGLLAVAAGALARRGEGLAIGLLAQIPIMSLGVLWVAGAVGREPAQQAAAGLLWSLPVWAGWVLACWILFRFTSLPTWACLTVGLATWVVLAAIFLWLVKS